MVMIKAAHYDEVEELLSNDPIVQAMAQGLAKVEREKLVHEDGSPRWEFMQKANAEYRERGGQGRAGELLRQPGQPERVARRGPGDGSRQHRQQGAQLRGGQEAAGSLHGR